MKHEWKRCLRFGATLFILYLAVHYWAAISRLLLLALGAAFPLLMGAVMAYAVDILMSRYERLLFPRASGPIQKLRRPVCLLLAYASLIAILVLLIRMILPELTQCVMVLVREVPPLLEELSLAVNQNVRPDWFLSLSGGPLADGSIDWQELAQSAAGWLLSGVGSVVSFASATVSGAFSIVVGTIFSIYLLLGKEDLSRQCARVMRTYLPSPWYSRAVYCLETLDRCFHSFIVGQCTEAVILGLLCMAGMLLFRFPYASMVGALIGFTALIPVAGAYIGAGVGAFMIFTISPVKALLFLVFICVLQQLEGNLIYPKVVGSSIGLPGIWVLAAVTVGGGVLGIFGMLLAVPLTAALYQMLRADVLRREGPALDQPPPPQDSQPQP